MCGEVICGRHVGPYMCADEDGWTGSVDMSRDAHIYWAVGILSKKYCVGEPQGDGTEFVQ